MTMENNMDSVTYGDHAHRIMMEDGSRRLAEAIYLARKGINPTTPQKAHKLPPAWKERGQSGCLEKQAKRNRRNREFAKLPQVDRMMVMLDEGYRYQDIAEFFKISRQKVVAMTDARREAIRKGFADRHGADRWG